MLPWYRLVTRVIGNWNGSIQTREQPSKPTFHETLIRSRRDPHNGSLVIIPITGKYNPLPTAPCKEYMYLHLPLLHVAIFRLSSRYVIRTFGAPGSCFFAANNQGFGAQMTYLKDSLRGYPP